MNIAYFVVSAAVVFVLLNSLLGKIKSWSLNASPLILKKKKKNSGTWNKSLGATDPHNEIQAA